jgi:polysaccharide export outer membrane protein
MHRAFRSLLYVLVLGCAGGCSSGGATVEDPKQQAVAPEQQAEYRIGPGDQLQVFVFNQPDLSISVPVRPDGLISTPLVEDMLAAGKTPSPRATWSRSSQSSYARRASM